MTSVDEEAAGARGRRKGRKPKNPNGEMPLREHLKELRDRLIKSVLAVVLGAVAGFALYKPVMEVLTRPMVEARERGVNAALAFDTVSSPFDVMLKVALFIGIVVSSPVWLYQAWAFVVPGLTKSEKKYAVGFLGTAIPLFLAGLYLAWLVHPQAVQFFIGFTFDGTAALPTASNFLTFSITLFLVFGVSMVLPVFLVGLNLLGVLPATTILKHWRIVVFLVALIAAMAAPGTDVISMFYLAGPLLLLFGISILVCWLNDRRRARRSRDTAEDLEAEIAAGPRTLDEL